jgi:large subunit ribosomal protein L10
LKREDKKKIAAAIHDCFEKSKVVILTDYKGLDVSAMNDLRRKLRAADVEYKVVKNTLIARAADGTDAELIKEHFKGPSALALSYEDPVAPAQVLVDFAKNNKVFEIKIGVMDGKVIDANEIRALSTLPSREVLLGQVLSAMNGVPTSLVRALNNVTVNLLNVLQAIGDQKEAA